eukprot:853300_1
MSHSNPSQEYDHLTIWCKNKQAMANLNLTDSQMKSSGLQDEIIDGVFGGFRNVISLLLRVVGTHSMIMLQSVLEAKSQTQSQSPQMTELPIDCLCHSFQYLTTDDRITAQQCCRSFAIAARDELAVNNAMELYVMKVVPNIANIIDAFEHRQDVQPFIVRLWKHVSFSSKYYFFSPKGR